jgi:hypothetical protein
MEIVIKLKGGGLVLNTAKLKRIVSVENKLFNLSNCNQLTLANLDLFTCLSVHNALNGEKKMTSVFIVQHSYQLNDNDFSEESKLIGVYSAMSNAEGAVKRLKKQPGFDQLPDYFTIDKYNLDEDNWIDGFSTEQSTPIYSVWKKDQDKSTLIKKGIVEADALRLVRDLQKKNRTYSFYARIHA